MSLLLHLERHWRGVAEVQRRRVLARFNDVIAATVADLSWRP